MATADATPNVAPVPRHQHLIVTIYGLYSRDENGVFAVSQLNQLLSDLGVESAGVRSSVSRLKKRGVLVGLKQGGNAAYMLAPGLEDVFRAGDERIFSPRRAKKGQDWLLTSFSIPESQRHLRHKLRTILTRVGCGQVSPGLWIAPGSLAAEIRQQLQRAELADYVDMFRGTHLTEDHIRIKVAQWWDLESLDALYTDFVEHHEPMLQRWAQDLNKNSPDTLRRAFADYVPMVTQWRRLPYMDPGLPQEYLPDDWSGLAAEALFAELCSVLGPKASLHAKSILDG